ncbi:MAG: helix-turn-helix transcriptional regulator [Solirubrobacteraceae bacterium]
MGRDAELAKISAARADPACPAVVVSAAAGVGKSRLAREACASAEVAGTPTLWAQATASTATIPLGALAALIPAEVRSGDPLALVRESSAAVRAAAVGGTVLLAVDDAHLLDAISATVVLQLATTPDVFVLATVRTGEATPDAVDALWKDAGAHRIDLERITDDAIAQLVEAGLEGPVEHATMGQVVDACAGNPLYARELVIGAIEDGRMHRVRGLWRMEGRPGVSPSLRALIKRRIGALEPEVLRPLELLALGEPLRVGELAALASLEALQSGEERGMLVVTGVSDDAEVRLAHPLYGDAIRAEMSVLRGRAHRLRLAETIQQRWRLTPEDALRAARWLMDAGAEIPPELLLDAADAASIGDPELAVELATRAGKAGRGLGAVRLLARAHTIRNRIDEAEAVLAAAEAEAVLAAAEWPSGGDREVELYVGQRMHLLYWGLRRAEDTRSFLARAERWSSDPGWPGTFEPERIVMEGFDEGFVERLPRIREQLDRPDLDARKRYLMEMALGMGLMEAGRMREADAIARRLRPRPPLRWGRAAYAFLVACLVGEESGEDWSDLQEYLREIVREAAGVGDREAAGLAAFTLGALEFHGGRYRDAERWLAEAEVQLEHHDTFDTITSIRALEAGIACFTGDPAAARDAVSSMRRRAAEREPRSARSIYLACGEGWAARAQSAAGGAEAFLKQARVTADPTNRSRLLHEALRAGARPGPIATALLELSGRCDSRLIEARASHAIAVAGRDGDALVRVADQLTAIGYRACAVEAMGAAAQQFVDDGRLDSARRAAARARELHPPNQGRDVPIIDGLEGVAVELTAREAQIATLAARGLSNQQIADQLVLSVRTVETYVYRAMQKKGVDNRHEL